jgi:hypothetical protein
VKLAVSSSSFAGAFRRGTLTHLEWLEGCASRLDADGVIFALADFPRTDDEYAAQLKKVAVDLGLVPVALDAPGLLDPERSDDERAAAVALAALLGTPLLRTSAGLPGELPPQTFVRMVAAAKTMAKVGKAANVTLAVAPVAGTLVATIADLKHLAKDVDSAWLRYDVPFDDPSRGALGPRERVLLERVPLDAALDERIAARRGWIAVEGDGGDDPFATVAEVLHALRAIEARTRFAPV